MSINIWEREALTVKYWRHFHFLIKLHFLDDFNPHLHELPIAPIYAKFLTTLQLIGQILVIYASFTALNGHFAEQFIIDSFTVQFSPELRLRYGQLPI